MSVSHLVKELDQTGTYPDVYSTFIFDRFPTGTRYQESGPLNIYFFPEMKLSQTELRTGTSLVHMSTSNDIITIKKKDLVITIHQILTGVTIRSSNGQHLDISVGLVKMSRRLPNILLRLVYLYDNLHEIADHLKKICNQDICYYCGSTYIWLQFDIETQSGISICANCGYTSSDTLKD